MSSSSAPPEAWLRGPVDGVPALLQGIALGLLHSTEEILAAIEGLTTEQLLARPHGIASVAFHVRHAMGSLDRLFTYARGEPLSNDQRSALASEKEPDNRSVTAASLANAFSTAVDRAIAELRGIDEATITEQRLVGRAGLPSTVSGLLDHAAQHTARHTGQIVTTAKLVRVQLSPCV